jgi:AcrR family transcriptional regulator
MEKEDIVRNEIVQVAETLFQRWGICKTTMEDIARETGKAKCTVYHYFENKMDVLYAVAEAKVISIISKAMEEVSKAGTAREKLNVYISTTIRELRHDTLMLELIKGGPRLDKEKERVYAFIDKCDKLDSDSLEPILRLGIETGEFKNIDPVNIHTAARAIMVIKRSLTINMFINNEDTQLMGFMLNILSGGL